ncbi:hypothetical protein ABFS82_14G319600 [Erythranthe guttata]|uniref:Deoxynucleoside kinase domain-containing protein n=2 Tax=Erythranthe guttata TaxID=4155 RepID=A0A022QKV9_ERYGU|nr:PREDICTED: uncharacterized protein LOC105968230 [Erythranthe guttata]EYU28229.1 hypothetical protein MIMGU_mgv1a003673mg [Erythranthe guttata]|eukprot:XP_012848309.1 PREDICTED: uncharacterized protein LOC105968230 [Erythranthe guttata]
MQKLLRRTPVTPPILLVNTPLSLPVSNAAFLSIGFSGGPPKMFSSAHSLHHPHPLNHPRKSLSPPTPQGLLFKSSSPCTCSFENSSSNTVPLRAWVVSKDTNKYATLGVGVGSHRAAWFTTLAGNSSKCCELPASEEGENDVENVKGAEDRRVQRRQRSGGAATLLVGSPDLLTVPGVGPKNLRKLVEKGFEEVAQLKQLYKDKFFGKSSQKMVEFLQSSVGIIHKNHAESITTFIKESVDEELKENSVKPAQKKRITLCVEGNISVGKSTFLQRIANETIELRDLVEIVPEPVDKWQNVGPDHFNILDAFYAEPERYAYTFQNYVFVTRVMQERESSAGIKPLRLMERSVFSDRMVFVRAVHEAKWMNEMEISIYDSWFDPVISSLPGLIPDGFIYLRASPDTCHKRMMLRKRAEEGGVTLDYLQGLHEKHESWLFPFQSGNHGVLSVSKLPNEVDWSLHPNIRDRVFYLDGDHMHSSIQKVPALVLDCEPDIDFSRDVDAKREYARQVAEFFEFVKKKKEVSDSNVGEDALKSNPVVLPNHGNLWMPGTQPSLNSLDFKKAMSFMSQQ